MYEHVVTRIEVAKDSVRVYYTASGDIGGGKRLEWSGSFVCRHCIVCVPLGVLKASIGLSELPPNKRLDPRAAEARAFDQLPRPGVVGIEFAPPLSRKKVEAITNLGFGSIEKVFVCLDSPLVDEEGFVVALAFIPIVC